MREIEAYVAELGGALRGPRTIKADLLAEVRDGLVDATEAYRETGLDLGAAQRQAVTDFGAVPDVAPDFQVELGFAQGRRTAVLIIVALAVQPVLWRPVMRLIGDHGEAGPAYLVVDKIVQWTGTTAIAVALLAVVGTSFIGARPLLTRATGFFAYAVCGVFALLGVLLTILSPATGPLLSLSGLPSTVVLLGLPLIGIGVAGRECLAAA